MLHPHAIDGGPPSPPPAPSCLLPIAELELEAWLHYRKIGVKNICWREGLSVCHFDVYTRKRRYHQKTIFSCLYALMKLPQNYCWQPLSIDEAEERLNCPVNCVVSEVIYREQMAFSRSHHEAISTNYVGLRKSCPLKDSHQGQGTLHTKTSVFCL